MDERDRVTELEAHVRTELSKQGYEAGIGIIIKMAKVLETEPSPQVGMFSLLLAKITLSVLLDYKDEMETIEVLLIGVLEETIKKSGSFYRENMNDILDMKPDVHDQEEFSALLKEIAS